MEYVYLVKGCCNKTGGFMSSNVDPYKVDFGIFSTLNKAMACAYANRNDDRLGIDYNDELPLFIMRMRLDAPEKPLFIDIVELQETWTSQ